MQQGLVTPQSAAAVPVIDDVLHRWQQAGGANIMTRFVNAPDPSYVTVIGWSQMMPGHPDVDLHPQIQP